MNKAEFLEPLLVIEHEFPPFWVNFCGLDTGDAGSLGLRQELPGAARSEALPDAQVRAPLSGAQLGQLECMVSFSFLAGNHWRREELDMLKEQES